MASIKDIVAYILAKYPKNMSEELSNARVTKMVYLADWRNCLRGKGQISNISWYFDNFGPFVWDIKDAVKSANDIFSISNLPNAFGAPKTLFALTDESYIPELSSSEKKSIDHIIEVSSKKNWNDFIKLVYSTYPISSSERYSKLDLPSQAKEYQKARGIERA